MSSVYSEKEEKPEFWFNLRSLEVEVGLKTAAPDRVGPFATEAEAKNALATLKARSSEWSAEEE